MNCILKCMLVLSVCWCVEQKQHWEPLACCLFQTFANPLCVGGGGGGGGGGGNLSFHPYWFMKGSTFLILYGSLSMCSWFRATIIAYWKQLSPSSFFGIIFAFLFLIYLGEFIYDLTQFMVIFWHTLYIPETW